MGQSGLIKACIPVAGSVVGMGGHALNRILQPLGILRLVIVRV